MQFETFLATDGDYAWRLRQDDGHLLTARPGRIHLPADREADARSRQAVNHVLKELSRRANTFDPRGDIANEQSIPIVAATDDAFRERAVELNETVEEAVFAREARVIENVVIRKDVDDTVRRTEVNPGDVGTTKSFRKSTDTANFRR